jgi:hypothetical protein
MGGTASEETPAEFTAYEWDVPEYEPPSPLRLKLQAREESWATVIADGDTAVFQTLRPWREYEAEADYRLFVSVAQPSVVEVTLNDKTIDLRDPQSRRISRVEINQANVSDFFNAPESASLRTISAEQHAPPTETMTDTKALSDDKVTTDSAADSPMVDTQAVDHEV